MTLTQFLEYLRHSESTVQLAADLAQVLELRGRHQAPPVRVAV